MTSKRRKRFQKETSKARICVCGRIFISACKRCEVAKLLEFTKTPSRWPA